MVKNKRTRSGWIVAATTAGTALASLYSFGVAPAATTPPADPDKCLRRRALAAASAAAAAGLSGAGAFRGGSWAGAKELQTTLEQAMSQSPEVQSGPPALVKAELRPWPGGFFPKPQDSPTLRWRPFQGNQSDCYGDSLNYPLWLRGAWNVQYKRSEVKFPQGWGMLNPLVPGYGMGSILHLPNVGAEPANVRWRFTDGFSGARPDWSVTLPSILQAFWPEARVETVPRRIPDVGWAVDFAAPTLRAPNNLTARTVTLTWLAGRVWEDESEESCVSVEWLRERDELYGPQGVWDYKVLTSLRRRSDGKGADGLVRVAGFLRPEDPKYFDAGDAAVAVYDYSVSLSSA